MAAPAEFLVLRYRPVIQGVFFAIYACWFVVAYFVPDWGVKLLGLGVQTALYVMFVRAFISEKPVLQVVVASGRVTFWVLSWSGLRRTEVPVRSVTYGEALLTKPEEGKRLKRYSFFGYGKPIGTLVDRPYEWRTESVQSLLSRLTPK